MDTQENKQDLLKEVKELSEALKKEQLECEKYLEQLIKYKKAYRLLRKKNWELLEDYAKLKPENTKLQKENAELKRELNSLRLKM